MKTKQLNEYAKLQAQIKELEGKRDQLKVAIVEDFEKEGIDKLENDLGRFTIATRTSYTYSDKVKDIESRLKIQKITEEEKGIAEKKTSEYLLFRPKA